MDAHLPHWCVRRPGAHFGSRQTGKKCAPGRRTLRCLPTVRACQLFKPTYKLQRSPQRRPPIFRHNLTTQKVRFRSS